jgi:hypothetical protein
MENEEVFEAPDSYSLNIIIEANREDEEPWRLNRIQRVIGYAQALADINNQAEFHSKIYSILDYKGFLTVVWKSEPTDQEKEWIKKAWDSSVADYENNVEHFVKE